MSKLKVILICGCLYSLWTIDCWANSDVEASVSYYSCDNAVLIVDNGTHYRQINERILIKLSPDEITCASEELGNYIQKSYPVKAFGTSSQKNSYYIEEQTTKYVLNKLMNTITAYEELGYDNGKMVHTIRTTWKIQPLTESEYQEAMKLKKERINDELVLNQTHFTISSFDLDESHSISCVVK